MMDLEELRSGMAAQKLKDVPFHDAVNDPDTRAEYIRRAPRTPQHEPVET